MTKKELIECLEDFDDDAKIMVCLTAQQQPFTGKFNSEQLSEVECVYDINEFDIECCPDLAVFDEPNEFTDEYGQISLRYEDTLQENIDNMRAFLNSDKDGTKYAFIGYRYIVN